MNSFSFPGASLFRLSRLGATAQINDIHIVASVTRPTGPGVRLSSRSDGRPIGVWVAEQEWCTWLEPQLSVSAFDRIDEEFLPLLAGWTLSPMHDWLQFRGLPGLESVAATAAGAPSHCWSLTFTRAEYRLTVYLDRLPAEILKNWLTQLTPSSSQKHFLTMSLGWCLLSEKEISRMTVGDVLPVTGMDADPDRFWIQGIDIPGKLQVRNKQQGIVVDSSLPFPPQEHGLSALKLETSLIILDAATLSEWAPDIELSFSIYSYPQLHLSFLGKIRAYGCLVKFDNRWGVRITSLPLKKIPEI